ncbi:site-specific integrase [Ferriphaselus amnicola]|uniref:site-specific integrase n=1 Tax=Ferriphaselus amnicola TaxID=1188319 RepID=UPI0005FCFF5F|nr:site-specific integrase [Ferriphaselus amnicola]
MTKQTKYPKAIQKNIRQVGPSSFEVRISKNGLSLDKTFDSLSEAKIYRDGIHHRCALDPVESDIISARLKRKVNRDFTVAMGLERYRTEKTLSKKGESSEAHRLNKLLRTSQASLPLFSVKPDDIIEMVRELKTMRPAAKGVKFKPISEATLKRYWNLIHHFFEVARLEWKIIDSNPLELVPKGQRPKDGKPRTRRLIGNEYELMLAQLSGEARSIFILAVETSMRRSELMGAEWRNINLKTGPLVLEDSKNGESRIVPLSSQALKELRALHKLQSVGKHGQPRIPQGKVFSITLGQLRSKWERARKEINAADLHFHDIRHESISRAFEKGLNVIEAAVLSGHKTISMLKRYANLHHEDIRRKLG